MCSAPSKALWTRSQAVIDKISDQISHYSRVYSRAQLAMVRLGADEHTLGTFQLLSKDDVKASMAVLKLNIPGSSSIRLSWIWESGGKTSGSAPETMRKCNLFHAYDLQINPYDEDKISSQDVVNYCEARFRVALQAMMKRSEKDQKWMYKVLSREMVCMPHYIDFV